MVDAVGGERILASPQHAQTGSTAYEAMWWRGGELLSLLQDLDEQGHVLALEAQHSWMDPSPRHPRAMTFGYAGGDGVWGAGGIYRLSASAGQVDVSLEFSRVDVLWGREPVRGSCLFEGTIKNGDALAFLARVRTREGTDAYHLVVFQAAAFSSSQWPYVACLTSARRLVNLGMPGLAKVADEGIAWAEGAEQASGPAAGKWTKELADGVVVRLVAVGRPAEHPFRWWDGDGRPVKVAPREIAPSTDGERAVLAELTDPNLRAAYPDWRWPHLSCWVLQEDEAHPGRVTVGAGTGPWEAVGTLEGVGNGVEADHAMYLLTEVKPGLRRDDRHNMPGTTNVKMSYTQRVVSSIALAVVDRDGREHLLLAGPPLAGTMPPTGFKATLFTVAPVDVGDIDHFVVKTRPRDWVSFTKIAWEPTVQNAANDRAGTGVGRAEGAQTRSLQGAASDAVGGITSD